MKNIYSITTVLLFFFTISLFGQTRIYPPSLRLPGDQFDKQNPDVILDWDAVTGQTSEITYEAQLATLEDFSNAVIYPRTDLTAQKTEDLIFGQTYYWRVKAFDGDIASGWSEAWSFEVVVTVDITDPGDGDEVYADATVKFTEISGLTKYELQLDTTFIWNAVNTGTTETINATFIVDEDNMWLAGDNGLVQYFNGETWSTIDAGTSENLNAISFINDSTGYVVGDNGLILSYKSGVWALVDPLFDEDLNSVSFSDVNNGWAVGPDTVMIQYKDGLWSVDSTKNEFVLFSVFAVAPDNVWVCGDNKIIMHYDGTSWTSEEVGTKDLYSIWFNDANNGWTSSKGGKIQYYNGTEWVNQPTGTTKNLFSISMTGETGFAVGKGGTMVVFEDGAWKVITSGVSETLNGIYVKGDLGLSGGEAGTVITKSGVGFDSPYNHVLDVSADSSEYELSYLPYGSKIYYRMRAMHSLDTSVWSEARTMVTYASPKLSKPKDTTSNVALLTLFKCKKYSGSTDYYFQIDDNEDFIHPYEVIVDSISTEYTMQKFGQKHYWRVKAAHPYDISDWSDVWWLSTTDSVKLNSPDDGMKDVQTCPLYVWDEMPGVNLFEIYIDTDPDFSNPVMNEVDEAFFQCQQPMPKKTVYYWKVRALTSADTSSWSEIWSFETEGYIGLEEEFSPDALTIYPNPNNGNFTLNINSLLQEKVTITVSDLAGKAVYTGEMVCRAGENRKEFRLDNQRKGLYLISIRRENAVITKKLFIR